MNTIELMMKPKLPEGYSTPELVEARALLDETQAEYDELTAKRNDLVRSLDAARDAHATAGRAYGANPTAAHRKVRTTAYATIEDFELQLVAAEETIEEFAPTLASVKANLDRIEAEALEAYRAAEKTKVEAAAQEVARRLADTIQSAPKDVLAIAGARIDRETRDALLAALGMPERFWSVGRAA